MARAGPARNRLPAKIPQAYGAARSAAHMWRRASRTEAGMAGRRKRGAFDIVGIAALAAVLLVLLGGWLAFPRFQQAMAWQDCVASGRTNCGG